MAVGPTSAVATNSIGSMSDLADPLLVARCADLARTQAEVLRARAVRLGRRAEASPWAGPAARAFRAETHELVTRLYAAARHLDDAADRLDRHAAALRTEAADAARQQAEEVQTVRAGLRALGIDS